MSSIVPQEPITNHSECTGASLVDGQLRYFKAVNRWMTAFFIRNNPNSITINSSTMRKIYDYIVNREVALITQNNRDQSFCSKKFSEASYPVMTAFVVMILALIASQLSFGQPLFQQDFSSSTVVGDYDDSAPTNGQFNSIGTSGAGTILSINSGGSNNKLRYARTANAGSYSRTTDFSPTPTSMIYRFDLTVSGNSSSQTTAAVWQVGDGFGTANAAELNADVHSRIGLNWTATAGQFSIRNIEASTNSSNFTGTQTITWVINNSGASINYRGPDGSNEPVANDAADLWIGTSKQLNDIAAVGGGNTLTDLKFAFTAGTGTVDIDNILIDPIPSIPTSNIATVTGSTTFAANWTTVTGVTGYRLDVAIDANFTTFVSGYNNLYVPGQATSSQAVTGLSANTNYWYRVRGASQYTVGEFASGNSGSQSLTTIS